MKDETLLVFERPPVSRIFSCAASFGSAAIFFMYLADHPTVKPVALVADAIRDVTRPGEIVLDAFMGSGTTILAAERTKRIAYGIEIEPGYIDVAIRRWTAMTGQAAVLAASDETFEEVAMRRAGETIASETAENLNNTG